MIKDLRNNNVAVLANAVELAAQAVEGVAGEKVADQVNGQPLSAVLQVTIAAKIKANISTQSGGSK